MTQQVGTGKQAGWRRWLHAIVQSATLIGVATIGLIWMSLAFHVEIERDNAEQAAIENSRNLARAFEAHLTQSLGDVDRTIHLVRAAYLRDPAHVDLRAWQPDNSLFEREVMQVSIVGADGYTRTSTNPASRRIYLGDREHFRTQAAAHEDKLHISKPVVGRISGRTVIQVSRRIVRPDGAFDGIITASLDPAYFARLYDSIEVGGEGYIRVIGMDGIIRAAGGTAREQPGNDLSSSQLFQRLAAQPSGWHYSQSAHTDHVPRLVVYRTVKDYPLIVTLGRSTREIFAAVDAKRRAYNFIAALMTILVLGAIAHSVHGRLALDHAAEDQAVQNARFSAALENMPHGMSMHDADGRLVVCNRRFLEKYGIAPEDAAAGTPLADLMVRRVDLDGKPGDPQALARELIDRLAEGLSVVTQIRLDDGRIISVANQPMAGGGFVAIHEDITERQRAERELRATKNFLDTVIENVPVPLVVKNARTQAFTFVNQAYVDFLGRPREKIIGRTVYDFYPREFAQHVADRDTEACQAWRTGAPLIRAEFPAVTPRGVRLIDTLRLVVAGDDGGPGPLITVFEDVTDRRKAEAQVVHLAMHDALTDLPNRAQFQTRLREALQRVARGERLAVHCLDLDNFKTINDALGHAVGDDLLKRVAARLRACLRESDVVARLGGDEFAIIQSPLEDPAEAAALARRVCDQIGRAVELNGMQAVVNTSIGIALAPADAREPEALLKQADMALYAAKGAGRGVFRFFEPEMDARMQLRHALEHELREAIADGELELHYQPVVDVASGAVAGMEALLRWPHPTRGTVPPSEFVSIAEDTGLIIPLGEWVLRRALADAARWPAHVRVAVNLSPVQFRSRHLAQMVISACAAARVSPARLELEVTEAAFLAATPEVLATFDQLRGLGVKIVLDDFGTGYSSLNYLRRFRFDKIKIDRSFVKDLGADGSISTAIVESVVRLARALDVATTAEGVETVKQLDIVRAAGVTEMQGFLYSAARPVEEIDALLSAPARKGGAAVGADEAASKDAAA
ncbi:MAG TPA: EAL domain-containing protein [Xanthobacteraceae bacterium]|nr:EAL domain-containing protein [Xanthobacteraceae bacterium]